MSGERHSRGWAGEALFTLLISLVLVAGACTVTRQDEGVQSGDATEGEPILIGAPQALTGFAAAYDGPPLEGAKIAIDEINANGGILGRPLELLVEDSKSDVNIGTTVGIELLDKGIEFMIAPCDFDLGAGPSIEANDRGVVAISTCAGSFKFGPEGIGPLAFTMSSPASTQGAIMAEFAYSEKGWRTAYVLEDPTLDFEKQACAGFRQRWQALGGEIVGEDTFNQEDQSIASQVTRIRTLATAPDAIFVCSFQPGLARAIRQIRAAGVELPVLGESSSDGDYWKDAVPNVSEVFFPAYASIYGDDSDPKVNQFFEEYEAKTGEPPATSSPLTGYAVMQALQIAAERAGTTDGAAVARELESFSNEPLIVGGTSFNSEFHIGVTRPMRVMQIQRGDTSFVTIWTPEEVPEVVT